MNIFWTLRRALLAGLFGIVSVSTGIAGTCGQEHCWGAVAVGPNGVAARASGLRTAQQAAARVDRVCRGACETREVFADGCGVLVEDRDRNVSAGFAAKREDAIAEAKGLCGASEGKFCRVRVWACSK